MPNTKTPSPADVQLHRNAHGSLVLTMPGYIPQSGVTPVRAFPLAAPSEGLSLMGRSGQELLWIERMDDLPAPARSLIEEELNGAKGLLYYESQSNSSGVAETTVTFEPGTNPDLAQVDVQNRIKRVESRLPQAVIQQGLQLSIIPI